MAVRAELLKNIRQAEPYVPGEQPQNKVIKLNTNENPYPPAPGVERVLREMDTDRFRLYPDPGSRRTDRMPCRVLWGRPESGFCGSRLG